ncbi:hypothetical protein LTR67_002294 [Exophiala xenobiotica]
MARLSSFLPLLALTFFHALAATSDNVYTVEGYEWNTGIALRCGVPFTDLQKANPTIDSAGWNNLRTSQILQLPSGASCPDQSALWSKYASPWGPSDFFRATHATQTIPSTFVTAISKLAARDTNDTNGEISYTVVPGDTAYNIAAHFGVPLQVLEAVNTDAKVPSWDVLQPGLVLKIPSANNATSTTQAAGNTTSSLSPDEGTLYTVEVGDTASSIADRFGISVHALEAANTNAGVANWDLLQPAVILRIPGVAHDATPKPKTSMGSATSGQASPSTPPPAPASTAPPPAPTASDVWTVASGDSGNGIASKVGIPFGEISTANPTVVWTMLSIGQTLQLPAASPTASVTTSVLTSTTLSTQESPSSASVATPSSSNQPPPSATPASSFWTVAPGDTGNGIASKAGMLFAELSSANPALTWTLLTAGQIITLPPGSATPTQSAAIASSTPIDPPLSAIVDSAVDSSMDSATDSAGIDTVLSKVSGELAVKQLDQSDLETGSTSAQTQYTFYTGDGSAEDGWPSMFDWLSFDAMYENAKPYVGQNCVDNVVGNSQNETDQLHESIIKVGNETDMDPRFILAVVMQESNGCVRIVSTTGDVSNPGLMQSDAGKGSCDMGGIQVSPCPDTVIRQMIADGTGAQTSGSTLVNALNQAQNMDECEPAQAFYRAARFYNSGPNSLPANGDLGGSPGSTLCYSSDIANRLVGWVSAPTGCHLDDNKSSQA